MLGIYESISCPGFRRCVQYDAYYYSTLGNVDPDGIAITCQNSYIQLPVYWQVAPDTPDSIAAIAGHTWSTDYVIVSSGRSYFSAGYRTPGDFHSSNMLRISGISYIAAVCSSQILIRFINFSCCRLIFDSRSSITAISSSPTPYPSISAISGEKM